MKLTTTKWTTGLALIGITASSGAFAIPMTWVDTYDFTPDRLVQTFQTVVYSHDITDNGFVVGVDDATSYALSLNLYASAIRKKSAVQSAWLPFDSSFFNLTGAEGGGWTIAGLRQLDTTGHLTWQFRHCSATSTSEIRR